MTEPTKTRRPYRPRDGTLAALYGRLGATFEAHQRARLEEAHWMLGELRGSDFATDAGKDATIGAYVRLGAILRDEPEY